MFTKIWIVLGWLSLFTVHVLLGQDKTPSPQYVYKEDLKRPIAFLKRGLTYFGYLDAAGNFLEDRKYPPTQVLISSEHVWEHISARGFKEPVYEYRSGFLIKGVLQGNGDFIPEEGRKVISFKKDYRYSLEALRIYNLPGRFEKVSSSK